MECSCDCYGDDGNMAEFFNDKIVTARKEYKCCECYHPIKKGEKHWSISAKWSGDFWHGRICLICEHIRKEFSPCSCYENLWEDICECLGYEVDPRKYKK
jgi:hypothetical protein